MSEDLRKLSKKVWRGDCTVEQINMGSLQRIADATEIMAKNYVQMQKDLDYYKREYKHRGETIEHLKSSRAAHKAQNTRLRNQLANVTS